MKNGISHRARRHLVCMISLLFRFFRSFVSWTSCLGLILAWCIFLTIDILLNSIFFFLVRSTLFWLSLTRAFSSLLFFRLFYRRLFWNNLLGAYLIEILWPFSNTRLHYLILLFCLRWWSWIWQNRSFVWLNSLRSWTLPFGLFLRWLCLFFFRSLTLLLVFFDWLWWS